MNWDSGFIAIGYARYGQGRAQSELSTLFEAQWANGMVPQIVFDPGVLFIDAAMEELEAQGLG